MKKIVLILGMFVAGFLLTTETVSANGGGCYDIVGGQETEIIGIPTCICGSGLECLCVTPKDCDNNKK